MYQSFAFCPQDYQFVGAGFPGPARTGKPAPTARPFLNTLTEWGIDSYLLGGLQWLCARATPYGEGVRGSDESADNWWSGVPRLGPGQPLPPSHAPVIPRLLNQAISGGSIIILGDGSQTRDFVYISAVVEALVRAGQAQGINSSVLNIGSGIEVSITELANTIMQVTGNRVDCLYHGEGEAGVSRLVADLTLSPEKLGYRPKTTPTEGLRLTIMRDPRFSAA